MQSANKNKTELLMKTIGVPGICDPIYSQLLPDKFATFLNLAEKNKIPLLFLRAVDSSSENSFVKSILLNYEERHQRTLDLIKFVAYLLESERISYTVFKTLKPFPYLPSDVDILLRSDDNLKTAVKQLTAEGCVMLDSDLYGVTMFSPVYKLNIDLTTHVAVSGMVYADKKLLFNHVCDVNVDGKTVRTLKPSVDLLIVAGHSVFKEQMYTLSDYYSFVMLFQHWAEAVELADVFHLKHVLETVLSLTRTLTSNAFGASNQLIKSFGISELGRNYKLRHKGFELPKKYDLSTILVEFSKKLVTDNHTLRSLSFAFSSFCNPRFYLKLVDHLTREKY